MMKRFMTVIFLLLVPGIASSGGQAEHGQAQFPGEDVNTYLVLLEADMRSADNLMAAIQQEARTGAFNRANVRRSAYLAEQAVSIAHARAQQLEQSNGLDETERANVRKAVKRLTDASASVGRLQSSMAIAPVVFRRQDEQNIRNEATVLRAQFTDAWDAINEVTNTYAVAETESDRSTSTYGAKG